MMFSQPSMFALLLLFLLAGCATTPYYGNYVEGDASSHNTVIASDAAYQLMQLYPPANTRFNMQHPTTDPFGTALIESLRTGGYAIQEHIEINRTQPANKPPDGTTLAYIFDKSSDMYRLSVMINEQILTRAYMPHKDKIEPAGSWVLKE